MNTLFLTTSNDDIVRAAEILQGGGLVAFPTETVYGLGANALDEVAVGSIFTAKGRPSDNPLIVHISNIKQLESLVLEVPPLARVLIDKFWPAPLTIVMKKSNLVPNIVSAGLDTVAIRMPNHKIALELIEKSGLPIAAPSANTSGKPSPTKAMHVAEDMTGRIHAIIDGGSCDVGVESTVIDVTGEIPLLLRPGMVTYEQLVDVLGEVKQNFEYKDGETPRSPGVKYKHYAPKAQVVILRGNFAKYINENAHKYNNVGVLCHTNAIFPNNCVVKKLGESSSEYAANLFAYLRDFDNEDIDIIFAEDIGSGGINLAVSNRLYKAAGYKIIEV